MVMAARGIPDDFLFQKAVALHAAGKVAQAQKLYQDILNASPRHAPALHHMGIALWQQGQAQKALPFVRRALKERPDDCAAHNTLGLIQTSLHNDPEAEKSFIAALSLNPDYAEAHFNYGRLLYLQRNWGGVMEAMEHLLKLKPDHALGRMLRLAALANRGMFYEVRAQEAEAFAHMPQTAFAFYLKGQVNFQRFRMDEAIAAYDQALAMDPQMAVALCGKAHALMEKGDNDAAAECLRQALAITPAYLAALRMLTSIHKFTEGDDVYKLLKQADQGKSGFGPKQKSELYYCWAKYYKDIGAHDKTFEGWRRAANAEHLASPYDHDKNVREAVLIEKLFSASHSISEAEKGTSGTDALTPVFIVGMPRSGTSLLEQILAAHPEVSGGGEMKLMRQALGPLEDLAELTADPKALCARLKQAGQIYRRWVSDMLDADTPFITDKMPYNYRYLGLIPAMMPGAKILHIQRHPLDTCLSCYSILFNEGHEWSYELGDLARYYRHYCEMMSFWRAALPEGCFLDVRYEALVADLEGQARHILDYCGLPWDRACLDFHQNRRAIRTASTQQVRRPLYTSSIGRWKDYEKELAPLAEDLQDIIRTLGYDS